MAMWFQEEENMIMWHQGGRQNSYMVSGKKTKWLHGFRERHKMAMWFPRKKQNDNVKMVTWLS